MAYRESLTCGYCASDERARCARCSARLCEEHRSKQADGWCWACAKELKDDIDLVRFKSLVTTPVTSGRNGQERPVLSWWMLAHLVAFVRERRVRRRVAKRSRDEIDAWRRRVGIVTRW